MTGHGVIRRYRDFLPVTEDSLIISLNEGGTPLIDARQIVAKMGANFNLLIKHEGLNPTASFKDRGMTLAITKAAERGASTSDGLGMLVEQAAAAFERWRGVTPDTGPLHRKLRAELDAG